MWNKLEPVIVLLVALQVRGDNCPYDGHVMARKTSSLTIFNQSLAEPFDRVFNSQEDGMECKWVIEAVENSKIVRLSFPSFHLKNSSTRHTADCVAVYDGAASSVDNDQLIQTICDRSPERVYNSSGKYLTVVFRQGTQGGRRWFSMNYTMVEPVDTVEASLVGQILGVVVVLGLFLGVVSFICRCCVNFVNNFSVGEDFRSCSYGCQERISRLCQCVSEALSSDGSHSAPYSAPSDPPQAVHRGSITLSSLAEETEDSGNENGPLELICIDPEVGNGSGSSSCTSESLEILHPAAPPPNYSSVVTAPSAPPTEFGSASSPTAPPMESALPYESPKDSASSVVPPPPSYESLFSKETDAKP